MPQFLLKNMECFHDNFSNIVHCWAKTRALTTAPSSAFTSFFLTGVKNCPPCLCFDFYFELEWISHSTDSSAVKCLIIKFPVTAFSSCPGAFSSPDIHALWSTWPLTGGGAVCTPDLLPNCHTGASFLPQSSKCFHLCFVG